MKLEFREIDKENFYDVIKLSETLTDAQRKCVDDNALSIVEGSVHSNAYYRGVFLDDVAVGFFMIFIPDKESIKDGEKDLFLWRFMIGGEFQGKHLGNQTLDYIVSLAKEWGFKEMYTSCDMGEVSPYEFYLKYGFTDTGRVDEGEQVLHLEFK